MSKFIEYLRKKIMSIDLLNKRLNYQGGVIQQQRMITDKLRSLKKALLYSYQAATAVLDDDREFRCLINPDKNQPAYDNKIISIPYKDICLNKPRIGKMTQGQEEIGLVSGQVFTWKETNTHWLVYLQYLEEDAYFRAKIRRCDQEIKVNDKSYWVYIRGPVETSIEWNQKAGVEWNTMNYSLVMYITNDENTHEYFHRFQTVKVLDPSNNSKKTWQVVGVDPYYGDGIIQVFLDEYFENSIQDAIDAANEQNTVEVQIPEGTPYIQGPIQVTQYSRANYTIKNAEHGHWYINWKQHQYDLESQANGLTLDIPFGDLGSFVLIYRRENEEDILLTINIVPM